MDTKTHSLAIDIGGSGVRARLLDARGVAQRDTTIDRAATGSLVQDATSAVTDACRALPRDRALTAIAVGARGAASLLEDPLDLAQRLSRLGGGAPAIIAADTVTAHLGALAGAGGTVIALGTGAIALGTDHGTIWRRTGGWGYLYDDLGSGFWVGSRGLSIAVRHHEGIRGDGHALLTAAISRFGNPERWPSELYPHEDRAARVAAFASDIAALDDPAARAILQKAGIHAAETLAASATGVPPLASATGGVASSAVLISSLRERLHALRPDIRWVSPLGTPLDGAMHLAQRAARGEVDTVPGLIWSSEPPASSHL